MKIFLPFTINLDPYIKKKIKEEQQSLDDDPSHPFYKSLNPWNITGHNEQWSGRSALANRLQRNSRSKTPQAPIPPIAPIPPSWPVQPSFNWQFQQWQPPPMEPLPKPISATTSLPVSLSFCLFFIIFLRVFSRTLKILNLLFAP